MKKKAEDLLSKPGYLTSGELCKQSDLTPPDFANLIAARLILPDTTDGLFRPKLVTWVRKLAYLLKQGWEIEEIRNWANGRWATKNPREWPPDRNRWRTEVTLRLNRE